MRKVFITICCGAIFVFLVCHAACRPESLIWKDILQRETVRYLASQGVATKQIVIGNSGEIELNLRGSGITNLYILIGMPLASLDISRCPVSDLEPLSQMRLLRRLDISSTAVTNLAPLAGLHLDELRMSNTKVNDLEPLRNMPLQALFIVKTDVRDLTPIKDMQLDTLFFSADVDHSEEFIRVLRDMKTLRCINAYSYVTNFWDEYDSGKFRKR
ncbi:MAG: hypothetical protein ACOX5G_14285 [Kiritimatiellia bacterium]|jgi:hypothetical protein